MYSIQFTSSYCLMFCLQEIDENHVCYTFKYLKNKPLKNFQNEQFLQLTQVKIRNLKNKTKQNVKNREWSKRKKGYAFGILSLHETFVVLK